MRLIDVLAGRPLRTVRVRELPRRAARPPTYWVYCEDATETEKGWRQITEDEAILRAVVELLDEGKIDVASERERLAIVEHFRRRAHVEASLPILGRAIGVSKQRAHQIVKSIVRNVQRYATGALKGSTARVSMRVDAAGSLRDFAGGAA